MTTITPAQPGSECGECREKGSTDTTFTEFQRALLREFEDSLGLRYFTAVTINFGIVLSWSGDHRGLVPDLPQVKPAPPEPRRRLRPQATPRVVMRKVGDASSRPQRALSADNDPRSLR